MPLQPGSDAGMPMSSIVIEDEMEGDLAGELGVQAPQEFEELLMAVAWVALSNDLTFGHLKCGEKGSGPVALVVVSVGPTPALLEGKARLCAVQRLDLALLIHAQHHRLDGRVHVQADDVTDFVDKQRITGELERLLAVRL